MDHQTSRKKNRVSKKENGFHPLGEETKTETHAKHLNSLSEEIKKKAHEIFCERNGNPGSALSDWLQAEQERRARSATA